MIGCACVESGWACVKTGLEVIMYAGTKKAVVYVGTISTTRYKHNKHHLAQHKHLYTTTTPHTSTTPPAISSGCTCANWHITLATTMPTPAHPKRTAPPNACMSCMYPCVPCPPCGGVSGSHSSSMHTTSAVLEARVSMEDARQCRMAVYKVDCVYKVDDGVCGVYFVAIYHENHWYSLIDVQKHVTAKKRHTQYTTYNTPRHNTPVLHA